MWGREEGRIGEPAGEEGKVKAKKGRNYAAGKGSERRWENETEETRKVLGIVYVAMTVLGSGACLLLSARFFGDCRNFSIFFSMCIFSPSPDTFSALRVPDWTNIKRKQRWKLEGLGVVFPFALS